MESCRRDVFIVKVVEGFSFKNLQVYCKIKDCLKLNQKGVSCTPWRQLYMEVQRLLHSVPLPAQAVAEVTRSLTL